MAYLKIDLFSNSLRRNVTFDMFLPNDFKNDILMDENIHMKRETKTLFLLHGYGGSSSNWGLDDIARKYNLALVMPSGENAFYLDSKATGHSYCTYIGSELIEYIRKTFGLAKTPDDTYIMGMSMGGFGAIHTALTYPSTFGKAAGLSSALIIHDIAHMQPGEDNGIANYYYYHECFGELDTVEESDVNPEVLIKKLLSEKKEIPALYLCCGTEDFLLHNNRAFHEYLTCNNVKHEYHESRGLHDMKFWNEYMKKAIEWMILC